LDWQRTAARHALQHYANANIILVNMLEQCRYLHIPLGNFPDDPCLFACDLFYARHLIKHNHLLWCSLTDQPDLGGKEQDDYRMLLTANINDNYENNHLNSNDNMFKNDNEGIHRNRQNHPFEINHSGFYPTSCIEFELVGLAICAVLNFQKIHEAEGSNFDLGFGTTVQNPLGGPGVIPSISNTSTTPYDETTQCLPALRLLRQMVQIWLQDVHSYTNIFADMQLNHFYRWLQSTKSLLYEPALKRTIQVFMRKLLVQLLVELQRIDSTTVYGNLNKIILATKRWSLIDTRLYIKVILEHLQLKDLTSTICLELKSIYHCLWWFDDKNYCGFRIWSNTKGQIDDNIDNNNDEEETIFDWNMIVYLPRVVQDYFETIMIGFARSIYDRLRDEYKEATSITQTNLPVKVLEYCRGLFTDELYQQLMSVTNQIERKLTKSDFDSTLLTPLSSTSPALEFVKSVCCLLFLLHDMHDDVMNLRRDLLKLLKLSEYSEMTTTNLSSLTSFVIPQLVCSNCNHYRDIDLYREINSTINKDSNDDEQYRQYQYTCNQCHTAYDQTVIEQYLLNHLQTLILENVLQDAICNKCHFVRNVNYKIYCDCGELYQNLHTTKFLNDTCIILSQIASKHQMIALQQQIQFLNRLNHWNENEIKKLIEYNTVIDNDILQSKTPLFYHLQKYIFIQKTIINQQQQQQPDFDFILKMLNFFIKLITDKSLIKQNQIDLILSTLFPIQLIKLILLHTSKHFNLNEKIQQFYIQLLIELSSIAMSQSNCSIKSLLMVLIDLIFILLEKQKTQHIENNTQIKYLLITINVIIA
ncbi:unnamed protein product, partial [Rotaria sordida]